MNRLFLDANVCFDLFQADRVSHQGANRLVKNAARGGVELVVSSIYIMNGLYSFRKAGHDMTAVLSLLNRLLHILVIAPVYRSELIGGINSGWTDLEDAVQFQTALTAGGIDAIVSNDKDFKQQEMIPILTPAQAVKRVK